MKHFAKSQEITAISWPFGEQNHTQRNISGLHIIRLETVIVYTAFSEGHRESDRGTNKERGEAEGEQAKVDFSPQSLAARPFLANYRKLQLCSYCNGLILRVREESRTSLHVLP